MKHLEQLIPGEDPFVTGERVSYMTYEAIAKFMEGFDTGSSDQAKKDEEKNYVKLSKDGKEMADRSNEVAEIATRMWKYSEPRTNKE